MRYENKKLKHFVLQLIIFSYYFNLVSALSLPLMHNKSEKSSWSRQPRQILPTSAVLLPNVGQYLSLIQILVLKLVIWTQIMRLLGQDYVGKGIKSTVPLSEQQDLDEILDYDDLEAELDLSEEKKRRRKRSDKIQFNGRILKENILKTELLVMNKFFKILKLNNRSDSVN